jgi:hypothetical protein
MTPAPAALPAELTTALAELPTYYGYLQPRLARLFRSAWPALMVLGAAG